MPPTVLRKTNICPEVPDTMTGYLAWAKDAISCEMICKKDMSCKFWAFNHFYKEFRPDSYCVLQGRVLFNEYNKNVWTAGMKFCESGDIIING